MKPNTIATFLAVAGLGLIIIVTLLLVFYSLPDKNTSTLNLILGNALGWVTSTFAFFFGSSTGNKTKDDTLASLAATAAAGAPGTTTTTTTKAEPAGSKPANAPIPETETKLP